METAQAYAWLSTTLNADSALTSAATGGVWQGFARMGTVAPYAVFSQQSAADTLTMNATRLFTSLLLQVKAVGPARGVSGSNFTTLVTIANRIDVLLGRTGPVTLATGGVLACYREQPIQYEELVNGEQWTHLGGLYRCLLQGA